MTLATGKGGRYRYYTCNTRIGQGRTSCSARSVSMDKLDATVLGALADRVFTAKRVRVMLAELGTKLKTGRSAEDDGLRVLKGELAQISMALERLYDAVEGRISTASRELAGASAQAPDAAPGHSAGDGCAPTPGRAPSKTIGTRQVEAFAPVLRGKLLGNKGLAKQYLRMLVSEVRVEGDHLLVTGSNAALAQAVAQTTVDTRAGVPTFEPNWLPDQGSNLGPAD